MTKWSLQARGQGGQFGVNGQGLPVAALPVTEPTAQNPWGRPLAPMVEMLLGCVYVAVVSMVEACMFRI